MIKTFSQLIIMMMVSLSSFANHFKLFDTSNGLSNNTVKCITQDNKGFMWFGTFDGLCRFDGVNFTVFRHPIDDIASQSKNHITALVSTSEGLWIGTEAGLFFFSFSDFQFHSCSKQLHNRENILSNYVRNIFTIDDQLYVLTNELLMQNNELKFVSCDFHYKKTWQNATAGKNGYIIAHSEDGLFLLDPTKNEIITRLEYNMPHTSDVIFYDEEDDLIYVGYGIGYETKVIKFNQHKFELLSKKAPSNVKCMAAYKNNVVFGTDGNGLFLSMGNRESNFTPDNSNISSDAIYSLYVDKNNNLWIGTYRGGAIVYSLRNDWFTVYTAQDKELTHNFVTAIYKGHKDDLYIGLDGGGMNIFNPVKKKVVAYTKQNSSLTGNNILSITGDSRYCWLGVYGESIFRYDLKNNQFKAYPFPTGNENLIWVMKDDGKKLWIGCNSGLYCFDKEAECFTIEQHEIRGVSSMALDHDGIWVSTIESGFYKLDFSGNIINHYHKGGNDFSIDNDAIRYIYLDSQHNIWFSTGYLGLNKLDSKRKDITLYNQENGLSNFSITGIQEDSNGYLWVSTYDGLFRFDPRAERFIRFSEKDNLLSTQFNYNASFLKDSLMYFGTTKGLVTFNPNNINYDNTYDPIYFTGFELYNGQEEVEEAYWKNETEIHLPYNKTFFTIHYSLPELISPERIIFSCYLQNFDKEWRDVKYDRKVSYTNVPPGEYLFCVRSTNCNGEWSEQYSSMKIVITPPWWKTIYAIILWFSLGIALFIFIFWFYQHELSNKHKLELIEIEKATAKNINEAKLRFITNITHELRTPIFLITAPLEELISNNKSMLQVPKSYLIGIHKNAMRLNKLISRIIDFRKLESGKLKMEFTHANVVTFCKNLIIDFENLCEQKDIILHFLPSKVDIHLVFDPEKLETILSNLVGNAVKYTPEGGRIILSVEETNDEVIFAIQDNGIGIKKEYQEAIFDRFFQVDSSTAIGDGIGLSFVKHLVELHEGNINVESEYGKGTLIKFSLPKREPDNELINSSSSLLVQDTKAENKDRNKIRIYNPAAQHIILIIDDEKETVELLERSFSDNYKILKAHDGIEGLTIVRKTMPDIIVCDIMMPKMNGFEFLTTLREDKSIAHVPVIMFTAKTAEDDMLKAFDNGADAYLTKPVSIKYLRKRIEHLLSQSESMNIASFLTNSQPHFTKEEKKFLFKCKLIIDENLTRQDFDVAAFSEMLGMSHSALYKKIKVLTGKSIIEFINEYRIYKACQLFVEGETNINSVCIACGYNDIKNFRENFKKKMGITPKQYIKEL